MSMKQKLKKPAIVLVWLFLWQMASVWLGHELLLVSPLRTAETLFFLMQDSNYWFRGISVSHYARVCTGIYLWHSVGISGLEVQLCTQLLGTDD